MLLGSSSTNSALVLRWRKSSTRPRSAALLATACTRPKQEKPGGATVT